MSNKSKKKVTEPQDHATSGLVLPMMMTIATVESLLPLVVEAAAQAGPILACQADQVEAITTPGAQLLISLEKTLNEASKTLQLIAPSPAVVQTFAMLGLTTTLNQWSPSHG